MKMGWRCGRCGREYSFEEFVKLGHTKAVELDTNPMEQHGYVCVCWCGYRFHLDKWKFKTTIKLKECIVDLSTVDLELEHDGGYYYETMIFPYGRKQRWKFWAKKTPIFDSWFQRRYKTKQDAIKGHLETYFKLKRGEYKIEKKKGNYLVYV